jgi:ribA/ribD-fused uncharacterized protein
MITTKLDHIAFNKVSEPHGWLGNMSPFPIIYEGKEWRTTEALFQAMRYEDEDIKEEIRNEKSPFSSKCKAKKHRHIVNVEMLSEEDVSNMKKCLLLKLEQHPYLIKKLIDTEGLIIYEDATARQRGSGLFWGAALIDGEWKGNNVLGNLWMHIRDEHKK